jgi:glycosylphosphatidylinositol transamidase (GPIT) subunit GPI8
MELYFVLPLVFSLLMCVRIGAIPHISSNVEEFSDDVFTGRSWALLVAGSKGYDNYRHQADICHAYQILRQRGVADDRIITMIYDDVAHSRLNPYKYKLFNEVYVT